MCSETVTYSELFMNNSNINSNINQSLIIYISGVLEQDANLEYIKYIFHKLNIGEINHINFINHRNNDYKVAYIVMKNWYNNIIVEHLQEKIIDENQEARLVHNDPNYWILCQNKTINDQVFDLQHQNNIMENSISEMQTSIQNLYNIIHNQNTNQNTNLYTNNSCCGAVSDAWNPMGKPSN